MKIIFLPRYDRSAASSRIRVFALHEAMRKYDLASSHVIIPTGGIVESVSDVDVVVNQKTDRIVRGKLTVFDYDDDLPQLINAGLPGVDLVTVDTPKRLEALPCESSEMDGWASVLPDCIDYDPVAPLPPSTFHAVAWFGNAGAGNFKSARWMFEALDQHTVTMCIAEDTPRTFNAFSPWSYDTFPRQLRLAGTALISHRGADQCKSENKMTAAITLGVPCIISTGSPACEDLARACGLPWCIVDTPEELREAVRRLSMPSERAAYLRASQGLIWDTYRAEVVARRAVQLYQEMT